MAKGKRFEVFAYLSETKEWKAAGQFPTRGDADRFIRGSLIGTDGVKMARIRDTAGEEVDRQYNCEVREAA